MKNILISTGGSGGHVVPAKILREHLQSNFNIFISTDLRGLKYLDNKKNDIVLINTPKLNLNIFFIFKIFQVIYLVIKTVLLLKKNKINIVFSTGGYMSLPVCFAAKLLGIKIYLLEPNIVLGRANRFFLSFCNKIFSYTKHLKNFPEKFKHKIQIISPLVKKNFYEKNKIKKENKVFCFLVVGGSQGAKIFDNIIKNVIVNLSRKKKIKIIQQTNKSNINNLKNIYDQAQIENTIFDFEENLADFIYQSDLCITRAGASTLAELSIMNKPFLAIPLISSKDNHQFENANFYKNIGCCWIMSQKDFNDVNLEKFLNHIIMNKSEYNVKKNNLEKHNFQNSWNDINQKILETINAN
ncbi:UDP-N-acetylglucosamine--N-acetylmuramyl-(pentapeptide) pyrophosphoryl-undecaprenol N-acetylglucosamine transferase [Candidatus Pelagibacter sp.]|nr:UDP-N-acetylglucosamine--N-acetylmuramyl-(pentapeptide) pyrophosphoryl-undecaprenol N-acetylglucosamine transferase [Candidatus Pelagibacter sp.]